MNFKRTMLRALPTMLSDDYLEAYRSKITATDTWRTILDKIRKRRLQRSESTTRSRPVQNHSPRKCNGNAGLDQSTPRPTSNMDRG
ncbi:hypothetical protein B9Z55_011002 [Caenorhabditis nigoni]|uniref:Uncharacterized protein n=1 Tax=Caenorhabditis nigoni TaxID=1611254 RepID=A0A2G5UID1_9PELO|nr:hypothetical protein B9Z55_011002 [Caenorhabditis nigoni]